MAIVISGVNNNDKITASDGTIDLLSGVSYAGIITAPAFTTTGNLTAGHLNIGSGIQLGNAGVATATTFVGNLTGNVNATSNLLLQIGGSEKFRVGSSGQLGIGGANYGTSGQVLTSGGSGSAASWSTVTGTTINNNSANRVITGEGGTTLNGEANLTFNGTSELHLNNSGGSARLYLVSGNSADSSIYFGRQNDGATGGIRYEHTDDSLRFMGYNNSERLRIDSDGHLHTGYTSSFGGDHVNILATDGGGISIAQNNSGNATSGTVLGTLSFQGYHSGGATFSSAEAKISGVAAANHTGSSAATDMVFYTKPSSTGPGSAPTERMRISQNGKVGINSTTPQQALDVRGSINGGSENQPFLRFHDSHGDQRVTKHYFRCTKGGTSIFDILTVDINTNFHQALIILYYGARIQNVADSTTYPVHKIIGVNRFNGGSIQFTKNTIVQNANATNHADIDAVATSSTNYRIRLTFSGTAGGSSFAAGYVEIIGLGPGTDGAFYSLAHSKGITR